MRAADGRQHLVRVRVKVRVRARVRVSDGREYSDLIDRLGALPVRHTPRVDLVRVRVRVMA